MIRHLTPDCEEILRRYLFLSLWIVLILFPVAWLARHSAWVYRLLILHFSPVWVHVVLHVLLFAVLAWLLASLRLPLPRPWRLLAIAGVIMLVALGQEVLQLWAKGRGPGRDELFDLGVDMAGAALGWLAFYGHRWWARFRPRSERRL
ncbi:MAG: hypothetical protein Kow0047_00340 [Anaerolineae bacterium]